MAKLTNKQADSNVSTRIAIATSRHALQIAELTAVGTQELRLDEVLGKKGERVWTMM